MRGAAAVYLDNMPAEEEEARLRHYLLKKSILPAHASVASVKRSWLTKLMTIYCEKKGEIFFSLRPLNSVPFCREKKSYLAQNEVERKGRKELG